MKGKFLAGLTGLGMWLVCAGVFAQNTVVAPSMTLNGGESGVEVRILLTNDIPIRSLSAPFVFRNVQGGAFVTSLKPGWAERLAPGLNVLSEIDITNIYPAEDGTCQGGAGGFATASFSDTLPHPVSSSPVGLLMFRNKIFSDSLDVGADAVGSIRLVIDVNSMQGQFEIDTTCMDPSNHLFLVRASGGGGAVPDFTKGIINIGHPPVARDSSWTTNEDVAKNVLYLPASDPDGNPLTFSVNSGPEHGTLSGFNVNTGAFTYTPDGGYFGPDSLKFEATDGAFISNEGTVRITVMHVNSPPVARDTSITTNEDVPVNGQLHATDSDGPGPLTFQQLAGPIHGDLTSFDANTGTFTYSPDLNYNGGDQFTFRVNDGLVNSANATVSITVTPVNDPPVARDTSLTTPFETALNTKFLATDVDGPPLTFTKLTGPYHGSFTGFDASTGQFTYDPDTSFSGPDSITFQASDGLLPSNIGVIRINVSASSCVCKYWGEAYTDGTIDILDFSALVDILFYNRLPSHSAHCPTKDADVNCDCVLDILDLNVLIGYLFYQVPWPCDPCTIDDCATGGGVPE